ncbi:MAG: DUF4386 family protein [Anaerolineaceae bacterium]|nr:DUF4386 family protein [Anaerolineaceae bacterium]
MKNLQKLGGFAALYLAAAYLLGITLFLVVLDYLNIVDPAQKVALIVEKQAVIYTTNLLMYVIFGFVLVVLALALYERLKNASPALIRSAAVIGFIWAGALIASGMVSNASIAPVVEQYSKDPAQAALTWATIETVTNGLSGGSGEILGGIFTLLISLAALQMRGLPKGLNILGLVVGAIGIISTIPGLSDLAGVFGLTQILWFVWVGLVLLRRSPAAASIKA